jgi:calcineurin-like phosphoesterase family protein
MSGHSRTPRRGATQRPEPATDAARPDGTVWFTADTHFGHAGAIGRFKRPFRSVAEMNETLIACWNERVKEGDQVWHLGDFAVRLQADEIRNILHRLNGFKHLVIGNNDGADTIHQPAWSSVQHYAEMEVDQTRLVLCHYPFRTWNGMYRGGYNLHGHSHGQLKPLSRQVDVGVDVWNLTPVTVDRFRTRRRGAMG